MLRRALPRFWFAGLAAEAEYRLNFIGAAVFSLINLLGSLFALSVLFQNGHELGGWSWPGALTVLAIYTILDGLQRTFLSRGREKLTQLVRDGTLDFALIQPVDSHAQLSLREVSIWGVPDVVYGGVLLVVALAAHDPPPGPAALLAGGVAIAAGFVALYALGFVLATTTIWFTKVNNVTIAMQALLEAARYPITAFPPAMRAIFTFVIPAALMTTVPAEILTRLDPGTARPWILLGLAVAVAIGLVGVSRGFWRFALRFYTSASS